ncbi:hypothetical protein WA158_006652 [Blastocystis sp. Blastoise]
MPRDLEREALVDPTRFLYPESFLYKSWLNNDKAINGCFYSGSSERNLDLIIDYMNGVDIDIAMKTKEELNNLVADFNNVNVEPPKYVVDALKDQPSNNNSKDILEYLQTFNKDLCEEKKSLKIINDTHDEQTEKLNLLLELMNHINVSIGDMKNDINQLKNSLPQKNNESIDIKIEKNSFEQSSIIRKNEYYLATLTNWFGKEKKWKLLFRASEHNYSAREFHRYCDNKGETVTIIKHIGHNNHINIFGGYTDQEWDCSNRYKYYSKEFLFTLSNEHDIPPTKYYQISSDRRYGIYCSSSYGPTFGGGYDIKISDQCHSNTNSYCCTSCYCEVNTPQKSSLFVNTNSANSTNKFTVEDYEVWGRA